MNGWRIMRRAVRAALALAVCLLLPASAALAYGVVNQTATEGIALGSPQPAVIGTVGSQYGAQIDWGDNSGQQCLPFATGADCYVLGSGEGEAFPPYTVYGTHIYSEQDGCVLGTDGNCPHGYPFSDEPYRITLTELNSSGGATGPSYSGTATVTDAPLTGTAETPSTVIGVAAPVTVAHFSDADTSDTTASDYTATIYWGDGSAPETSAQIEQNNSMPGHPGFDVIGRHSYASPSPSGGYHVTVDVIDEPQRFTDSTVTVHSTVTATASGALPVLATEGQQFNGLVAQYCSTPQPVTSATIDWGDGTSGPASSIQTTTLAGSTCYQVSASHTYAEEHASLLPVVVTPDTASGAPAATGHATVIDAPLSVAVDSSALVSTSLIVPAQTVLAHATDANPGAPPCAANGPCDLSATIEWGDGSSSPGTVTPDPSGGLDVTAGSDHSYPGTGKYPLIVTMTDVGGASRGASGTYTVTPPPAAAAGCQASVPALGATRGLYGAPVKPGQHINWGISSDDRVLRFGELVICSQAPWIYRGSSPVAGTGGDAAGGGVFETSGQTTVNGLYLLTGLLTVDTGTATLSTPGQHGVQVYLEHDPQDPSGFSAVNGFLGYADMQSAPWQLQGQTLGYIPNSSTGLGQDVRLTGPATVRVTGLGTSAVDTHALLPSAFSLLAYSGGPVSSPITYTTGYQGLGPGVRPALRRGREIRATPAPTLAEAHVADAGCQYPSYLSPNALKSDDLFLGGIELHCAYLDIDTSTGNETGGGQFQVGTATVSGELRFQNGNFQSASGGVDGLNAPVFPGVTLNSIHFGVFLDPSRFHASAGLQVAGGLASLTGGTLAVFATNDHPYYYNQDEPITGQNDLPGTTSILQQGPITSTAVGIGGEFYPFGLPIDVHGYVLYEYPTYFEFGGQAHIGVGPVSADGYLQGQFWLPRAFDVEGGLNACFGICLGVKGLVSSRGMTACGDITINYLFGSTTYSAGFSDAWGQGPNIYIPPFSDSCDDHFGDYRVTGGAAHDAASGPLRFTIPRGQHAVMVKVPGSGDAPQVTITGPGGVSASTGAANRLTGGGQFGLLRVSAANTTYIAIAHPAAGTWTIAPQVGSAPVTGLEMADWIPSPSVHAAVSRQGHEFVLHYSIRPRPGQTVRFAELSRHVAHSLGTVSATHGTLRFTPAVGPGGLRTIDAYVSRDGVPTSTLAVARYRAPATGVAARPRHVVLTRRGAALLIRWTAASGAARAYRVVVIASDGRRLLFTRGVGTSSMIVPDFSQAGASVMVLGVGADGNQGPAAVAKLSPLAAPARVDGLRITRSGKRVRVSWRRAARAIAYRLALRVTGWNETVGLVLHSTSFSFTPARSNYTITASIRGQGAFQRLGPTTSVRLGAKPGGGRRRQAR
jgi:hypothetical protein